MKPSLILFLLLVCVISFHCNNAKKPPGLTAEQLATNICQCSEPLKAFNEELKTLAEQSDNDALMIKMSQGDDIMTQAISCVTNKLENDISHLITPNVNELISGKCQLDARMANDMIDKIAAFKIPQ